MLKKLKELKERLTKGQNRAKRIMIGNKAVALDSKGKVATNLKERWGIE
tara:strand:+ start:414 stop:560 length:147 start_codon:yes stop_codon:yes gene_type:complete